MRIAILGCGAIGGAMLGFLTRDDCEVFGVVRDYQRQSLLSEGLIIQGIKGKEIIKVKVDTKLSEKVDLAIFATKINDLKSVIEANRAYLSGSIAMSTQNGIGADDILSEYFSKERIITSIVMFGATFYSPNKVVHNFGKELTLGNIFEREVAGLDLVIRELEKSFTISTIDKIKGAKYLKVLINLNNCIPAILGKSMQETFADIELANLAICLNREAYEVVYESGIKLESLSNYPKERLQGLVAMPVEEAAGLFSKMITGLSKEPLFGSILQSIKRNKKSEIDYINGEIVQLAKNNDLNAPLNEKITDLVHRVEDESRFFTKEELLSEIKDILQGENVRMSDYRD